MNVIKRSGEEVEFNAEKIENAIKKANEATDQSKRVAADKVHEIAERVIAQCSNVKRSVSWKRSRIWLRMS